MTSVWKINRQKQQKQKQKAKQTNKQNNKESGNNFEPKRMLDL